VPDDAAERTAQTEVLSAGAHPTEVIDRFWFKSVYFKEPGGALFEIATDGPGFGVDEPMDKLGETLVLPPFLEGRRKEIEAGLKPL
jgi:glyoxalase family protein